MAKPEVDPSLSFSSFPKTFGEFTHPPQPDPIIGLSTEFAQDKRPNKLNAAIGYLVDETGQIYIPPAFQKGLDHLVQRGDLFRRNGYLTPEPPREWSGDPVMLTETARMVFGDMTDDLLDNRLLAATTTVGGSQAISLVAEAVANTKLGKDKPTKVLLADPPYPNHPTIFKHFGLPIEPYTHTDKNGSFDLEATLKALQKADASTLVVLQGKAHNPTGVNANIQEEWEQIAEATKKSGATVFFDVPYPGTGDKFVEDDFEPVRTFVKKNIPTIVATSYSKIGGLYEWRVGSLYVVAPSEKYALETTRYFNGMMRRINSSAPGPGQHVVGEVLGNPDLFTQWRVEDLPEVAKMLQKRRQILADVLPENVAPSVREGTGLFTYLPITKKGAEYLKRYKGLYVVAAADGNHIRVNLGGLTSEQMVIAADAIKLAYKSYHS